MNIQGNIGFYQSDHIVLTLADISLELRYMVTENAPPEMAMNRAANGQEENSAPPELRKIIFCL